jgi:hypothetical protein
MACSGTPTELMWNDALLSCPVGYRVPTIGELTTMLGGCDAEVLAGGSGYCATCVASPTCSAMFGVDDGRYWSSSPNVDVSPDDAWFVFFDVGRAAANYKDIARRVRCVR